MSDLFLCQEIFFSQKADMACIMLAILFLQSTEIARIIGRLEDEMRVQCGLVICVYKTREKLPTNSS